MPHFSLNLKGSDGHMVVDDVEGENFPSVEHAFIAAFESARELWSMFLAERVDPRSLIYEIADNAGEVIMTLPFSEVLDSCSRLDGDRTQMRPSVKERRARPSRKLCEVSNKLEEQVALSRSIIARSRDLREHSARLVQEMRVASGRRSGISAV